MRALVSICVEKGVPGSQKTFRAAGQKDHEPFPSGEEHLERLA